jgi:DNA mismatch endonuclease (patch repair protein)
MQWTPTERSPALSGRRSKDTAPELALRRALHAQGLRFRLHRTLARGCTPDLVLPSRRVAVFVDGDYWHGCPRHFPSPGGQSGPNATLWRDKRIAVAQRDARSTTLAHEQGWSVVRIWECEIHDDVSEAVRRVLAADARSAKS